MGTLISVRSIGILNTMGSFFCFFVLASVSSHMFFNSALRKRTHLSFLGHSNESSKAGVVTVTLPPSGWRFMWMGKIKAAFREKQKWEPLREVWLHLSSWFQWYLKLDLPPHFLMFLYLVYWVALSGLGSLKFSFILSPCYLEFLLTPISIINLLCSYLPPPPKICWISFLLLATNEFYNRKGVSSGIFNQIKDESDLPSRIFICWLVCLLNAEVNSQ